MIMIIITIDPSRAQTQHINNHTVIAIFK